MLFLEIILTVTAWNRGYKAWALIPLACALFIGLMIGASDPELAESDDWLSYIWIDVLAIVALGLMIANARKPEETETLEEPALDQENYCGFAPDQAQPKPPNQ
jgi:hypothetical protein